MYCYSQPCVVSTCQCYPCNYNYTHYIHGFVHVLCGVHRYFFAQLIELHCLCTINSLHILPFTLNSFQHTLSSGQFGSKAFFTCLASVKKKFLMSHTIQLFKEVGVVKLADGFAKHEVISQKCTGNIVYIWCRLNCPLIIMLQTYCSSFSFISMSSISLHSCIICKK